MKLLSVTQAAKILNCSKRTVYRLLEEGALEGCKVRNLSRITEKSVNAYIERQVLAFQIENGPYHPPNNKTVS